MLIRYHGRHLFLVSRSHISVIMCLFTHVFTYVLLTSEYQDVQLSLLEAIKSSSGCMPTTELMYCVDGSQWIQ